MELTHRALGRRAVRARDELPGAARRFPRRCSRSPARSRRAGYEAWCVGGALRDTLLGHPHSDYDFATSATPGAGAAALPPHRAGRRQVRHRRRARPARGRCTRSPPSGGTSRPTAATRWSSTASRSTTISPAATSRSTPSPTIRCGTSGAIRSTARDDLARRRGPRRGRSGRALPGGLPADPARPPLRRAVRLRDRPGDLGGGARGRARPGPALGGAGARRVVQGPAHGALAGGAGAALARVGAAERWMPELASVPRGAPRPHPRRAGRASAIRCCSPRCLLDDAERRAPPAQGVERGDRARRGDGARPRRAAGADAGAVRRWLAAVGRAADDLSRLHALRTARDAPWAADGGARSGSAAIR